VWEYFLKEKEVRDNHIPPTDSVLFLEIQISDASEFVDIIRVKGVQVGDYRILRTQSAVPNAIAALYIRTKQVSRHMPILAGERAIQSNICYASSYLAKGILSLP